jgi:hypothetical protein
MASRSSLAATDGLRRFGKTCAEDRLVLRRRAASAPLEPVVGGTAWSRASRRAALRTMLRRASNRPPPRSRQPVPRAPTSSLVRPRAGPESRPVGGDARRPRERRLDRPPAPPSGRAVAAGEARGSARLVALVDAMGLREDWAPPGRGSNPSASRASRASAATNVASIEESTIDRFARGPRRDGSSARCADESICLKNLTGIAWTWAVPPTPRGWARSSSLVDLVASGRRAGCCSRADPRVRVRARGRPSTGIRPPHAVAGRQESLTAVP